MPDRILLLDGVARTGKQLRRHEMDPRVLWHIDGLGARRSGKLLAGELREVLWVKLKRLASVGAGFAEVSPSLQHPGRSRAVPSSRRLRG